LVSIIVLLSTTVTLTMMFAPKVRCYVPSDWWWRICIFREFMHICCRVENTRLKYKLTY
jgi:hypothetical protein